MPSPGTRVLILGGSELQLPAITAAADLGCHVGVVDRNPEAVGAAGADEFFQVSTTDVAAIVEVARSFGPDGILTLGTDLPMRAVAAVSQDLGLWGPEPTAIRAATDKGLMAQAFRDHGVAAPDFAVASSAEELAAAVADWDYPFIVKPVDSAGSRGVTLVETPASLAGACRDALDVSRGGRVIAQEYLRGAEISVEGFCLDDGIHVVAVTDKITTGAPEFVEMGHTQPSLVSGEELDEVHRVVAAGARALGVEQCAFHVEVMRTATGPRLIEFGARLGGDFITTDLVPLSTGVDMVRALVQLSCGQTPDLTATHRGGSAIRYLIGLRAGADLDQRQQRAAQVAGVTRVVLAPGTHERIRSSVDRPGHVIARGANRESAVQACHEAAALIGDIYTGEAQ